MKAIYRMTLRDFYISAKVLDEKAIEDEDPHTYGDPRELEEDMRKENEELPYCDKAR